MNYFKSRWSGNTNVQVVQPQPNSLPNSVTFANGHPSTQNPIIITSPSHISIVTNPQMNVPNMIKSPTESFHSVSSNFHNQKHEGRVNMAYNESSTDMTSPNHHHQTTSNNVQHPLSAGQNR